MFRPAVFCIRLNKSIRKHSCKIPLSQTIDQTCALGATHCQCSTKKGNGFQAHNYTICGWSQCPSPANSLVSVEFKHHARANTRHPVSETFIMPKKIKRVWSWFFLRVVSVLGPGLKQHLEGRALEWKLTHLGLDWFPTDYGRWSGELACMPLFHM